MGPMIAALIGIWLAWILGGVYWEIRMTRIESNAQEEACRRGDLYRRMGQLENVTRGTLDRMTAIELELTDMESTQRCIMCGAIGFASMMMQVPSGATYPSHRWHCGDCAARELVTSVSINGAEDVVHRGTPTGKD